MRAWKPHNVHVLGHAATVIEVPVELVGSHNATLVIDNRLPPLQVEPADIFLRRAKANRSNLKDMDPLSVKVDVIVLPLGAMLKTTLGATRAQDHAWRYMCATNCCGTNCGAE